MDVGEQHEDFRRVSFEVGQRCRCVLNLDNGETGVDKYVHRHHSDEDFILSDDDRGNRKRRL